jgi:hypothetical protein
MPAVIPILIVAGTAWSAYQQHKQAKALETAGEQQHQAANAQADLQDYNARVADLQASDALVRGAEAESRFRTTVRGAIGTQRAGFAGANIDVGFGSAVDVQADAAFLGELDALTIRANATREAWGFNVGAEDMRRRALITRREGVNLEAAGRINAGAANAQAIGTLIGGTTSLLQQRYGFNRAGGSSAPTYQPQGPG